MLSFTLLIQPFNQHRHLTDIGSSPTSPHEHQFETNPSLCLHPKTIHLTAADGDGTREECSIAITQSFGASRSLRTSPFTTRHAPWVSPNPLRSISTWLCPDTSLPAPLIVSKCVFLMPVFLQPANGLSLPWLRDNSLISLGIYHHEFFSVKLFPPLKRLKWNL